MSPRIGITSVDKFRAVFIARHCLSILNKLNSDTSNKINLIGLCFKSCLAISDPMDPPAPEIKRVLLEALSIISSATLALGSKSSKERF